MSEVWESLQIRTNHVLPTFHSTFQYPSNLVCSRPSIERIERDDVGPHAVKGFPVDFEMPLVAWGNTALFDILSRVWCLNKLDRAETSRGDKAGEIGCRFRGTTSWNIEGNCKIIQFWVSKVVRIPPLRKAVWDFPNSIDPRRRARGDGNLGNYEGVRGDLKLGDGKGQNRGWEGCRGPQGERDVGDPICCLNWGH